MHHEAFQAGFKQRIKKAAIQDPSLAALDWGKTVINAGANTGAKPWVNVAQGNYGDAWNSYKDNWKEQLGALKKRDDQGWLNYVGKLGPRATLAGLAGFTGTNPTSVPGGIIEALKQREVKNQMIDFGKGVAQTALGVGIPLALSSVFRSSGDYSQQPQQAVPQPANNPNQFQPQRFAYRSSPHLSA